MPVCVLRRFHAYPKQTVKLQLVVQVRSLGRHRRDVLRWKAIVPKQVALPTPFQDLFLKVWAVGLNGFVACTEICSKQANSCFSANFKERRDWNTPYRLAYSAASKTTSFYISECTL